MVDTDRITGAAKELGGKVQGAVGDLTGSKRDSRRGACPRGARDGREPLRPAKDAVRDAAERVADTARDIGWRVREGADDLIGSGEVEDRAHRARGAAEAQYARAERSVRHAADEAYDVAEDAYENGGRSSAPGHPRGLAGGRRASGRRAAVAGFLGYGLGLLIHAATEQSRHGGGTRATRPPPEPHERRRSP